MKSRITNQELVELGQEWQEDYKKQKQAMKTRNFKYTTWSIVTREDLTSNEKIALCFINAASALEDKPGISTGRLQALLQLSGPTIHRVLKNLIEMKEIKHGRCQGIWVVTETEKLF